MSQKFTHVQRHADSLADGRPVAPDESVLLTADDLKQPHNQRLIAEGALLPVSEKGEKTANQIKKERG